MQSRGRDCKGPGTREEREAQPQRWGRLEAEVAKDSGKGKELGTGAQNGTRECTRAEAEDAKRYSGMENQGQGEKRGPGTGRATRGPGSVLRPRSGGEPRLGCIVEPGNR